MAPTVITDANFEELVLKSDKTVVLDLWAEWCGPCRMIEPHIEAMAEEFDGKALIGSVDVDSNPDIPSKYAVMNIPTVLFIKGGELVDKVVGAVPKKVLVQTLEKYL
ncbi:MAG: thioredoxin [Bacteroidales bacterium]|nr:thioredoxin [Bacteroidales bacterium]